ncbi:hypothetical protein [Tessaracoccus oleiagri]|uniref:hypothetical protein n=1 Tax=Tessaracoccus oleiagri TaxID=686624 RepID=UPI00115FBE13|nr:hypothetical protein [Tessaracoccus oleiagri]
MNTSATSAVHRADGELIGHVTQTTSAQWVPCTAFGVPIGEATSRDEAETFLNNHGLGYLAERWTYNDHGQLINVQIVEASPTSVTLRFVDYGRPDIFGKMKTLQVPVGDELRMA